MARALSLTSKFSFMHSLGSPARKWDVGSSAGEYHWFRNFFGEGHDDQMSFVSQYTIRIHIYLLPQKTSLRNFPALQWLSGSVVSDSLGSHGLQPARLLCPWDFSRQEYWSGLPFPSPGDLPDRDWTRVSCIAGSLFTVWATGEPGG